MFYLCSIPRSGSTLLASLLLQRGDTHVSKTSNLGEFMGSIIVTHYQNPATEAGKVEQEELMRTLKAVVEAKYSTRTEEFIFDKGRCWPDPNNMKVLTEMMGEAPKIVATVRPLADCVASFYMIDKGFDYPLDCPNPLKYWMKNSELFSYLIRCYESLKAGYKEHPENFCLIDYDDLCNHTQRELDRISDFIGAPRIDYDPTIKQIGEDDNAWGVKDLHLLESEIKKTEMNTREILGDELFRLFDVKEFWSKKPATVYPPAPLDLALEAGLHGDFVTAEKILRYEYRIDPKNNRAAFNLGWYEMRKGNLQKGHRFLDCGREEEIFGNRHIGTTIPIWNGQRDVTVLLEMEGGIGDQFHCVRYCKNLVEDYGCKVIVSGSAPILSVIRDVAGVHMSVMHEASLLIDFDYWLPSMSAPISLKLEYSDVSGESYIPRLGEPTSKIGVKWSGNPMFEHEQHRLFPPQLMFDAVKDEDCICLQKEDEKTDGLTPIPEWMEQPSLATWKDTQLAISRCELVITSCTGVAHLSAAMGVETWIVVPMLAYYLWAKPGKITEHYNSVKLYRQEEYGNWRAPFERIKQDLISRRIAKWDKIPIRLGNTTLEFIEA